MKGELRYCEESQYRKGVKHLIHMLLLNEVISKLARVSSAY